MANQLESFVSALKRMGGGYGSAWRDGVMQTDVVGVTAGIEIGRAEVQLVGQNAVGYKPTRASREGTVRTQKIDSRWDLFVWQFLGQSLEERRAVRGTPEATLRTFSMKVAIDDPDAYGYEAWQLDGCQIWRMQLGSEQGDEVIEREYPLTWEKETPLSTFEVRPGGIVVPVHSVG
jgi:hypothetical protein